MSFVEAEKISFAWGASQILREVSLRADTGRFKVHLSRAST